MINTFKKITSVLFLGALLGLTAAGCDSNSTVSKNATLESFVIDGSNEIANGTTMQLNTIAVITDGTNTISGTVNDKVEWKSSNTGVATVDNLGVVTSVAEGFTVITASAHIDSEITTSHRLRVVDGTLISIQIEKSYNPSTPQPISTLDVTITTEEYITVWGIYADGSRRYVNTDAFLWSSDQQVASINSFKSSNVYGRDLGTVTVTAYFGGQEASITVNVIPEDGRILERIEIRDGWGSSNDVTNGSIGIEVGNNSPVVAYGYYSDAPDTRVDINAKVAWTSSDPGTAFILDEISSYVYGIRVGSATITAKWQGVEAYVTANIVASTAPVLESIEIQKGYTADGSGEVIDLTNPLSITVSEEFYVTAWGNYSNGTKEYINTEVYWRSDDPAIASMPILQTSSNVTGESAGTTQISARFDGVEGRATVNVTTP